MKRTVPSRKKMLAMNEALMIGSVRQHELTEAAKNRNWKLQREIVELERVEAQRRMEVLTASNRKLRQEIVRRRAVAKSLEESKRRQSDLLNQSRRMQKQLQNLSRQVLQAQEEERKSLSRELHDVIAQTLTGINVQLNVLTREAVTNPKVMARNMLRTQRMVEKSVDRIRRFARELRPAVLDDLGLIPALHSFLKVFSKRTGLHVHLKASPVVEQLEAEGRTVLFRVAQEAITNVARHAFASRVEARIEKVHNAICMKIKDDGKSFAVDRVLHGIGTKRLGLLGMRERLEMVGGSLENVSHPGDGTIVIACIPFRKAGRKPLASPSSA